jgi:hypothetical protein
MNRALYIENVCPACHANLTEDCYYLNEAKYPDFWICKECGSDRIGCHYIDIDGFDPFEVHNSCKGYAQYTGVNIDTWQKILTVYHTLRGKILN